MAWVKLDDQVPHHPKFLQAGAAASWLWVCSVAYCQRQMTDGFIPQSALPTLGVPQPRALAQRLLNARLWDEAPGGFTVHDYLHHNLSRAEQLAREAMQHESKVKAGRAGGFAAARSRRLAAAKQPADSVLQQTPSRHVAEVQQLNTSRTIAPSHPIPVQEPPYPPHEGGTPGRNGRLTRQDRRNAETIRKAWGRCRHDPPCATRAECVDVLAAEQHARAVTG